MSKHDTLKNIDIHNINLTLKKFNITILDTVLSQSPSNQSPSVFLSADTRQSDGDYLNFTNHRRQFADIYFRDRHVGPSVIC